jgi:alkyl sulfatase BDS1-like metallo-beta-lactamase superfamily hydrolase
MSLYSTGDHPVLGLIAWEPAASAERVNDYILMSRSTSHSYLVTSDAGDVLINAGTPYQGVRHRERFEALLGRPLNLRKIIFTQSHPDHIGGWGAFADAGVETVVQREFPRISDERKLLGSYFMPRAARVLMAMLPKKEHREVWYTGTRDPEGLTLFADSHSFTVGGRAFELLSVPSGETLDSLVVWLPRERVLFTGNWMGAIYGALPNFYTPRGDRQRSVPSWLKEMDVLLGLKPELLITGHGEPIVGNQRISADLGKLRDAVRYIHDETVKGMNAHKDLHTLMQEIELPPHLVMGAGRGPVRWYVRAVFEEYTGWFRQESTTELYAVPPRAIWAELTAMAGGAGALAARAQAHVAKGEPVEALHFTDIAKAAEPANHAVLEAELAALELLVEHNGGKSFDELGWLESNIQQIKAALGGHGAKN